MTISFSNPELAQTPSPTLIHKGNIELDHFNNIQSVQQLESLVTADMLMAVIDLGHNDSITLSGVTTGQVQQLIQTGHILLH